MRTLDWVMSSLDHPDHPDLPAPAEPDAA
jgi:hypothetical protein